MTIMRIGSTTDLKTESFPVFESARFATTEQQKAQAELRLLW